MVFIDSGSVTDFAFATLSSVIAPLYFLFGLMDTIGISMEFANAKSHLNLTDCPHPFHNGDLPPLIEYNGYAYMSVLINKFKIKDILGKVVIIHDSPDDFTTQPSRKLWNKNCLR